MPILLKDTEHPVKLRNRFRELYRKKAFCDLVLRSSDGSVFRTHRLLLATYSNYFKQFVSRRNLSALQTTEVVDLDIKSTILSALVDYMYRGEFQIEHEAHRDIRKAAKMLELQDVLNLFSERFHQTEQFSDSEEIVTDTKLEITQAQVAVKKRRSYRNFSDLKKVAVDSNSKTSQSQSQTPVEITRKRLKGKSVFNKKDEDSVKRVRKTKKPTKNANNENVFVEPEFQIELDVCESELVSELESVPVNSSVQSLEAENIEESNSNALDVGSVESVEQEEIDTKDILLKQLDFTNIESPAWDDSEFEVIESKFKPPKGETKLTSLKETRNKHDIVPADIASESYVDDENISDNERYDIDYDDDDDDVDYDPVTDISGPIKGRIPPIIFKPTNKSGKSTKRISVQIPERRLIKIKLRNRKNLHILKKKLKTQKSQLKVSMLLKRKAYLLLSRQNAFSNPVLDSDPQEGDSSLPQKRKHKCRICNKMFVYMSICRSHIYKMHILKKIGLKHKKLAQKKLEENPLPAKPKKCQKRRKSNSAPKSRSRKIKEEDPLDLLKNPIQCLECERILKGRNSLRAHLRNVHKISSEEAKNHRSFLVKCEIVECDFTCLRPKDLESHTKSVHPGVEHRCPVCNYSFVLTSMLNRHMSIQHIHRDRLPYQCDVCGKRFSKLMLKKRHELRYHGIQHDIKQYKCQVEGCGFSTPAKESLVIHGNVHKEKMFQCQYCGNKLKTKKNLQIHINKIHLGIRPFLCQICGDSFGDVFNLKSHINGKHTKDKEFKCPYCPYMTSNKSQHSTHIFRIHGVRIVNKKEHKCPKCPYKSILKSRFEYHMETHSTELRYFCDQCDKGFVTAKRLEGHKNWNHKQPTFSCTYCNYVTKGLSKLNEHVETQHTMKGFKPYECPYCDFTCATAGNTRKHIMGRHKGQKVMYKKNIELLSQMKKMKMEALAKAEEENAVK